jgi:dihydroneopterin triphosphate diphosphatase
MRLPIQVITYPVRQKPNSHWEYLLLQRTADRGGFWQGASGGVEDGESIAEAALRELREETGLAPLSFQKIDLVYTFHVGEKWRHLFAPDIHTITEHVFLACVSEKVEARLSKEHQQYKWCLYHEAFSLLNQPERPDYLIAIKKCAHYLTKVTEYRPYIDHDLIREVL